MRGKTIRGAGLLALALTLLPAGAMAQDATGYAPGHPVLWTPLGSTRPEDGGFFVAAQYAMYRQTNPLKNQLVAVRGFLASDNTIPNPEGGFFNPGTFVGTRTEALNVEQVSGPGTYTPGTELSAGWRFQDGSSLTLNWLYLATAKFNSVATLNPPGGNTRVDFADTFLTSYVYNFPPDFQGPDFGLAPGPIAGIPSAQATAGIWNGASVMTQVFEQRAQKWELLYRMPVYEEESYRLSGIMGPRFFWIWERYKWTTQKLAADGTGGNPENIGIYTNIVSNRMYGAVIGCSNEYYLGHGFACMADFKVAGYVNSVKERAKYERGDKFTGTANKRAIREFTVVPEFEANLGLMWYPTEAVQLYAGYDVMLFLNTISSPRPVDFNYSSLTPSWESTTPRWFDGFRAGIAIHF